MQCINILMPLSNCFLFLFLVKISDDVFLEEDGQADLATDINDVSTGLSHNISHTQGASFVSQKNQTVDVLYWHFSVSFFNSFFFQISYDVLIEADNLREGKATGYIHHVSPLKNNHFDFQLQTKNKTIRGACFG